MTGKIKTTSMKVNCLLQATLGCLTVQDFALTQDVNKIFRLVNWMYLVNSQAIKALTLYAEGLGSILERLNLTQCCKSSPTLQQ